MYEIIIDPDPWNDADNRIDIFVIGSYGRDETIASIITVTMRVCHAAKTIRTRGNCSNDTMIKLT